MKKYSSYKNSGVEWIGKIPSHWETQKLKYCSLVIPSNVDKHIHGDEISVKLCNYTDVYYNEKITDKTTLSQGSCSDSEFEKNRLINCDVVITKDSESPDDIGVPCLIVGDLENVVCGYHLTMIRPTDISGGYLFRFIQSDRIRSYFEINSSGITRYGLGKSTIENMFVPIPSPDEQKKIVSFLDEKTSKIDRLIQSKQLKIDLLKEKRTSLINEVVTKGLNPNVEMKDSGVDWIGEIPNHWKLVPLKYLGRFQNGISKGSDYFGKGSPFMNYGDVYKNEVTPLNVKGLVTTDEKEQIQYSVERGDVFFTRTSESKDDIGVSSVCLETISNCVFSGFVIRFRFYDHDHYPEYSRYHFQTHWKKTFIESKMDIVTRSSLSQQVLGQVPVLIPPKPEQKQIFNYLDSETHTIDKTISLEKKKIDLLKEYKQSLISEVVTGKINVQEEVDEVLV